MMAAALKLTAADIASMRQEHARRHLVSAIQYIKHDYLASWFHKKLGRVIEKFLTDCINGKSPRLIIEAPPRHGKALSVDEVVPTPDGFKRMADLRVGDSVFAVDGSITKIVAVSETWKNRKLYKVTTNTGDSVVADAAHEWVVRLDRGHKTTRYRKSGRVDPPQEPKWVTRETEWLANRTGNRRPLVPCAGALQLPYADLPIAPYTLGVWLGDGKNDCAFITQGLDDAAFVMGRIADDGFVTRPHSNVLNHGVIGLHTKLRENDLLGNKHVPAQYLRASIEQRLALLQGLIDTDGHVSPDGQVEFCNTNEQLALAVAELARSLGVKASVIHGRATLYGKDCGPKYRVMFYMNGAASIPRKAELCKNGIKQPSHYISFEAAGYGDTVCIEIEHPSHLFLAGIGMLPTCNSEEASRYFPAYALGKYPDVDIIATSYSSDLASSINRDIQRIIDTDEYHELFPTTSLWGKNIRTVADGSYLRNSDVFEIVNHKGVYKSAGVGAGVTGRGARIILVDDPIKDAAEAGSETVRQSIWDWFTSTLYTRLMPGGGIIVIMTRWHMDDLVGRLKDNMKKGGEQWQVFSFPAVAEHDEFDDETGELLRYEGEALHPERYPLDLLMKIKLGTSDDPGVGSRVWASLYQQRPTALEGGIFKREWWKFLKPPRPIHEMQNDERAAYFKEIGIRRIIQRWDTALGEKKQNDYTACCTLGIAGSRYYVLDVWQDKLQFPDVSRTVELRFDDWHPTKVCIEGGGSASGKATVQAMKRTTLVPLFETVTTTDKTLRAETVSPNVESGLVYFFEGCPWVSKFVDHCADFPNIKNNDDVDAFIGALEEATTGRKPMQIANSVLQLAGVRR